MKLIVGLSRQWWSDGTLFSQSTPIESDSSLSKLELYESWHENGSRLEICLFKDEKEDGLYQKWYETGELFIQCTYKFGIYTGLYQSWYQNGNPLIKCFYRDPLNDDPELNTTTKYFHCPRDDNNLESDPIVFGVHVDGIEHGLYQHYYENGHLKYQCTYDNGVKHGLYQEWNENGQLTLQSTYENGTEQ